MTHHEDGSTVLSADELFSLAENLKRKDTVIQALHEEIEALNIDSARQARAIAAYRRGAEVVHVPVQIVLSSVLAVGGGWPCALALSLQHGWSAMAAGFAFMTAAWALMLAIIVGKAIDKP